jgi:hypothetical protein
MYKTSWCNDQKVQKFVESENENFLSSLRQILYFLALYQSKICTTRSLYEELICTTGTFGDCTKRYSWGFLISGANISREIFKDKWELRLGWGSLGEMWRFQCHFLWFIPIPFDIPYKNLRVVRFSDLTSNTYFANDPTSPYSRAH